MSGGVPIGMRRRNACAGRCYWRFMRCVMGPVGPAGDLVLSGRDGLAASSSRYAPWFWPLLLLQNRQWRRLQFACSGSQTLIAQLPKRVNISAGPV